MLNKAETRPVSLRSDAVRVAVVDPHRQSRNAELVARLRHHADVVGIVNPAVTRMFDVANKARYAHPDRDTWRARAYFNGGRFRELTENVARGLDALPPFDVALHVYPIHCALPKGTRYVVVTDNTMAVTQRQFRRWANLSKKETARALARERSVLEEASYVATWGPQARRSAIDDYGCDPERVVEIGYASQLPAPLHPIEREDRREALFVATSFWRKGGETLLKAWPAVSAAVPDATLTIVGPSGRPPSSLPAGVTWVGPQQLTELPAWYRRANVLVNPTLFESSLPNVIREAMMFNLPIVASDVSAIADDAPPEVALFPSGDASALAGRLIEVLGNHDRATELGLRLRRAASETFSWDELASRVAGLVHAAYDRPVSRPGAAQAEAPVHAALHRFASA